MDLRRLYQEALGAHRAGDTPQAERLYRAIVAAEPGHFPALHMLGLLENQRANHDGAIAWLETALRIKPGDAPILSDYGHALLGAGRKQNALAAYDQVLAQKPGAVSVLYNRTVLLSGLDRAAEALPALDHALALQPQAALLFYSRGLAMTHLKRPAEALADFDQALALQPNLPLARGNRAMAALNICDWTRRDEIATELVQIVDARVPVAPLTLLGFFSDKALLRRGGENAVRALVPQPVPPLWRGETYNHDRIRLVYVSSDFRDHAVAHQLAPLIERHDRSRFEVIAVSVGADDNSPSRARLVTAFDGFHDMQGRSTQDIARLIRELEADIAIDLNGHTHGARSDIFAWRPAPVQAGWLGYPGTMGELMDVIIADAVVAPVEDQPFYSEDLVHLPDSFFPTDPGRAIAPVPGRADAGLPANGLVFCCFNKEWKITAEVFAVWMRLLAQIPESVLWLKQTNPAATENLCKAAAAHGIDPARLIFAGDVAPDAHLARQACADLFLDTLPYNAHATAADALWAGLPVITCQGKAFSGRVGASLLHAAGLPELITQSLEDYEAQALRLARDPRALQALKEKLARNRVTAPLFDADRFCRNIEAAYTQMHAKARAP